MTSWHIRGRALPVDKPVIMGILNATPDSFSDGGKFLAVDAAVEQALAMMDEGADIVDVGGESTRPQGATPVSADEEMRRTIPVIEQLARARPDAVISIDTVKSSVARAALDAGAHIVNDVSGLRLDPRIADVCAQNRAGLVIMHSRGDVADMATYAHAEYSDVVAEVIHELRDQRQRALAAGVAREAIVLDPGIGFSKRSAHSLAVLAAIGRLRELGHAVLVGVSRKRLIGEITGVPEPAQRLYGTVGANVAALWQGARIFRVHDVRPHREALDVAWHVAQEGGSAEN